MVQFSQLYTGGLESNDKRQMWPHARDMQDSLGFWNPRREFRIPGSGFDPLSVELGFWISIESAESRIPQAKFSRIGRQVFCYSCFSYFFEVNVCNFMKFHKITFCWKIKISPHLIVIGIPESEQFLLVKSRILGSGIQNAVIGNPESR